MAIYRKKETFEVTFAQVDGTILIPITGMIATPAPYQKDDALVTGSDGKTVPVKRSVFDETYELAPEGSEP